MTKFLILPTTKPQQPSVRVNVDQIAAYEPDGSRTYLILRDGRTYTLTMTAEELDARTGAK